MTHASFAHLWSHKGWASSLAVVALGVVAVLGFAPFHIWGLTLLGLTGLFVRLVGVSNWDRPGWSGFRTGLLFGLGWFSAGCFWIASAFIERGPEFVPMIPPLVGGLAVLLSLFWGAAGALTARLGQGGTPWRTVLVFIGAFMMAELARGHVLTGFPWNMAGYAFEPGGAISQSASLFGIYGLTMTAYAVSALAGWAMLTRNWRPAVAGVLMPCLMIAFGSWRLSNASQDIQPGVVMRLVAVPFRQSEKIDPATSIGITNAYLGISLEPGIEEITHLVWPEGPVNGLAIEDEALLQFMGRELAARTSIPPVWLMNSLREEIRPSRQGSPKSHYYNSSIAVTFDALGNPAVAGINDKRKLVPFGEFIPGGEIVEAIGGRLVSTALGSITPAPEKRVSSFPGLPPIVPQICYEVIFPGLTPKGNAAEGRPAPQAILNQSNDAWFGATVGPAQHAAIARYRAIEEGMPLIRSAANGISGVFDGYGRAEQTLDGTRRAYLDVGLPKSLDPTLDMKWVNLALVLLNLCLILVGVRRFGARSD